MNEIAPTFPDFKTLPQRILPTLLCDNSGLVVELAVEITNCPGTGEGKIYYGDVLSQDSNETRRQPWILALSF